MEATRIGERKLMSFPTMKICMFTGQYGIDAYKGKFYAKAQNLSRTLRSAYDAVLEQNDLLVMPTLPIKATKLPQTILVRLLLQDL